MKKIFTEIWQFVKNHGKYLFVILLFILVLIFGENFSLSPEQREIKLLQKNTRQLVQGEYKLASEEEEASIGLFLSSYNGDYYRMFFDARAEKNLEQSNSEIVSGTSPQSLRSEADLYLETLSGKRLLIKHIGVEQGNDFANQEITFRANDNYSNMVIRRANSSDKSLLKFRNFTLTRLNCKNDFCLNNLYQTVNGPASPTFIDQSAGIKADTIFKFTFQGQIYGQIFKASKDNLSDVSLALNKKGSGGLGIFQIELREVEIKNGEYKVKPMALATTVFESENLADFQTADGVYQFPIAAELEVDKNYFIGLSSKEAKINFINTLEILGDKKGQAYKEGPAIKIGSKTSRSCLYFSTFYRQYQNNFGEKVLLNSRIEDLGEGVGIYSYKFSVTPADYLDIYQKGQGVYFDPVIGGISAPAKDNNFFIYKFDTGYPFKDATIEASQAVVDYNKIELYFSYDEEKWQKIETLKRDNKPNDFRNSFSGDGQKKVFFVKVIYDRDDKNKKLELFNLQKLTVHADLLMDK